MISHKHLLQKLHYDPETGVFTWLVDYHYLGQTDTPIDIHKLGKYQSTCFYGNRCYVHRLAYFYMTGEWPDQVDHIDGNRYNNKWSNLRSVTSQENHRNTIAHMDSKGIMGVGERGGKFRSGITINRKQITLGTFTQKWDAICARKSAEHRFGFHPNHGRLS